MNIENVKIGDVLKNKEISEIFNVSTTGGVRYSIKNNHLVLIQLIRDNPYSDTIDWKENTISYVGTGQKGDQNFYKGGNKRIYNSLKDKTDIYFFISNEQNKYYYFGKADLVKTYNRTSPDVDDLLRNTVIFDLKLEALNSIGEWSKLNKIYNQMYDEQQVKENKTAINKSTEQLIKSVKEYEFINTKTNKRITTSTVYHRNQYIVQLAKKFANGECQLCGHFAPFNDSDGQPFLEVHHIDWLSEGGKDGIENVIAICPNCHRKMHILKLEDDVKLLKRKSNNFAKQNGFFS